MILITPSTLFTAVADWYRASPVKANDYSAKRQSDYLKRIPEDRWQAILSKIEGLNRPATEDELEAFRKGKWDHPIFADEHWPYIAFHAFLEGKILQEVLNRLFLYDACKKQASKEKSLFFQKHQLYNEMGQLNTRAEEALRYSLQELSDSEFESLKEELREVAKTHPEETQFFAIHGKYDRLFKQIAYPIEITGNGFDFPFLSYRQNTIDFTTRYWQIVPPPSFVDAILKAKFGENTMHPAPVLGFSPFEELTDPYKRVMFIPCPLFPSSTLSEDEIAKNPAYSEKFHNMNCTPLSGYHHDIHHLYIESANVHRPLWIDFAKFVNTKGYKKAYPVILDRDMHGYYQNEKASPQIRFWTSLSQLNQTCRHEEALSEEKFVDLFVEFYTTTIETKYRDLNLHDIGVLPKKIRPFINRVCQAIEKQNSRGLLQRVVARFFRL